jgi:hypothetical protein
MTHQQVTQPGALCLNASRWDALHAFANATDSKIVFGLSYPQVSAPDDDGDAEDGGGSGVWNSTQAEALFAYSKKMGHTPETVSNTRATPSNPAVEKGPDWYEICSDRERDLMGFDWWYYDLF